jgi:hypothetical protein
VIRLLRVRECSTNSVSRSSDELGEFCDAIPRSKQIQLVSQSSHLAFDQEPLCKELTPQFYGLLDDTRLDVVVTVSSDLNLLAVNGPTFHSLDVLLDLVL